MSKVKVATLVGGEENSLCFQWDCVFSVNSFEALNNILPTRRRKILNDFSEWKFYNQIKKQFEDIRSEALPAILGIPTNPNEMGQGSKIYFSSG